MKKLTFKKWFVVVGLLAVLSVCVCIFCIKVGLQEISWAQYCNIILQKVSGEEGNTFLMQSMIIFDIRMPRVLLSFLVGMALSVAGAVFQALLRNPLAEPHLIGVSSGAALGGVLAGLFFATWGMSTLIVMPLSSFLGGLFAVGVVYTLARRKGVLSVYTLLLVGVILNSFFISIIIFIQTMITPDELANVFSWLLGSITLVDKKMIWFVGVVVFTGTVFLSLQASKLNLLSLGEVRAQSLGVAIERVKRVSYIAAALLTGVVVAVSGLVGFIGLVVPHIARMLFGPDHRVLIPASACIGGILLVIADTIARTVIAPQEIPVGVITAFLGAPFFIFLLKRKETRSVF